MILDGNDYVMIGNCDHGFLLSKMTIKSGLALIIERAVSPSSGFLQIENRTIFGWDMAKTTKKTQ